MNCFAARAAATSSAGPLIHPTFQPVQLNVFAALEIRNVRSRIPGSVANGVWVRPSNSRCS